MKKSEIKFAILFFVFIFCILFVEAQSDEKKMIVEANIFKSNLEPIISIEVPDYVFLGNLTVGEETGKVKIYINNSGNVNVTITPQLSDTSEIIFSNLFFQRRVADPWKKISEFNFNISKPSSSKKDDYFYMKLDLTDFTDEITDEIDDDMLGHKADVVFLATPQ